MATTIRPKPVSGDVAERILEQMDATLGKWERRGYCPCCVARILLLSSGLLAAPELQSDEMREALGYIAVQSEKHAPRSGSTARH